MTRPTHWHPVAAETDPFSNTTEFVFVASPDVIVIERSRPMSTGRQVDRKFYPVNGVTAYKTEDEARSHA